ncbi:MAG TPA: carbohydrate porin [Pseudorhodoplanes sp.]|nr:carbohydrate porin [Pseudorhodoplanes sp.]
MRFKRDVVCWIVAAIVAGSGYARADDTSIWDREQLTGDWNGARTALKEKGVEIGLVYIGETLAILSGGLRRGQTYEGRLEGSVQIGEPALWKGATVFAKAFQIHNAHGNAADYVGSISDPSNIDALPTTRLFTLWFEQKFGESGSVRLGQLAADDEFLTSTTAGGLINGTFGWASMMAANLPSGGPAYPLATPGVRVQVNPVENISVLGAVFSGDPAGRDCNDLPQACNRFGTTFSLHGGAFWIGEIQYLRNQEPEAKGLAAAYKLGAWYHSGSFADQRFGIGPGGTIVSQATGADPLFHRGNWGIYGVIDQMLVRNDAGSFSFFARGGASPSDRNLLSWYVDGGFGVKGLFGRPDDTLTFGVAYNNISSDAAALDQDTLALNGPPYPIRSSELVFELSYIYQVAKWWTIQPDVQYILRPGGNVPDPSNPALTVGNAFIFGARSTIVF